MLYEHAGARPAVHADAWVAPTAVLSGDVRLGPGSCVLHGAVLTADGGPVVIGGNCVVMEHAVVRGSRRHPVTIGDNVLLGPHSYVSGATLADNVFVATGAAVFNGAVLGERTEVRIRGVVHLRTRLPPDATVPIGWVAVGDPPVIAPPDRHDEIWAAQEPLNFPKEVFGLGRPGPGGTIMPEAMARYTAFLRRHRGDRRID